ncbi:MAG: AbrB/MazE/SpoVT family DNA-binding domain-containing protein [Chloroflexota bacterium]|nr:AbrB/MazE/SpoVT family DNA-binding domain-containing protein [Chloroflexota bacterium]
MDEVLATLTSKGQITIPAAIRKHLGVDTGDKVAFVIEEDGSVQLRAPQYRTVAELRGTAGTLAQPRSWPEMRAIAREDRLASERGK